MARSPGDARDQDAELRFLVVGPLLKQPLATGELRVRLEDLAQKAWYHPKTGLLHRFAVSTIERWYYTALKTSQPLQGLRRRLRKDRGRSRRLSEASCAYLRAQYTAHSRWSSKLHRDNLLAAIRKDPSLGTAPSTSTVRRFLEREGLFKRRRRKADTEGGRRALARFERLEVRSFEHDHVGALWHLDFHLGSRRVLTRLGQRLRPALFGVLDDCSRFVCHLQWYLSESTETLVHGLCQALQKQGLPRELMMDQGAAMTATETRTGLLALGITPAHTLPYSPYQNGKQENFWNQIENRLLAMLEQCEDLTLARLNDLTQVWLEADYHGGMHSELGMSPRQRHTGAPSVLRSCPESEALRRAFRRQETRRQRRSDGTLSVAGIRFEVPSAYAHLRKVTVRYAGFDLRDVDLVDEATGTVLARMYPQDKARNAEGYRRVRQKAAAPPGAQEGTGAALAKIDPAGCFPLPPLLEQMLEEASAKGTPPSYLPSPDDSEISR